MDPRREKKCINKNSTNHNFFEPWANKFYAHLQKKLFKKLSKFYDFFFPRPIMDFWANAL